MNGPDDLDAAEILDVRLDIGRDRLRLRMRLDNARTCVVSVPCRALDAVVSALPCPPCGCEAQGVASWEISHSSTEDILLTLRTPQGQAFVFAFKPWQMNGIATLARYGRLDAAPRGTQH